MLTTDTQNSNWKDYQKSSKMVREKRILNKLKKDKKEVADVYKD